MSAPRVDSSVRHRARAVAGLLAGVLAAGALGGGLLLTATPASADTAPPTTTPATPATVSADALPTVQQNGVVWSQVTVGNTVYATGSFTSARPAGSAAGTNETPRKNLLAYDITTGNLVTSFNHSLNAQGLVVTASADGSRVYVGGDFTTVDGVAHNHIVEINTATGALVKGFAPTVDARVAAIATSGSTVYAGGSFTTANGVARSRLAAFGSVDGGLLPWAPSADDAEVDAMVLAPDRSKVVVGGKFSTLSGVAAYGMGALDPSSGAVLPWAANQTVRDAGSSAGITSLRSDGTQIYGTGFVYGAGGNLEGVFAANPSTGAVAWVEDCHGDTYDTFTAGQVLYAVSHSHECATVGAFPETTPRSWHWTTAYTSYPTQTLGHNTQGGYADWFGTAAPTQLDWYPQLEQGSYTGQGQAGWSATGNSSYVALGGEFPRVNGTPQQGLVRFAVRSLAPNKMSPLAAGLTPSVLSLDAGTARVVWKASYDVDNEALTYKVIRDGNATVFTTTVNSRFYQLPAIGFTDTGLAPGSTHTYRVYASDPLGNTNSGSSVPVTVTSTTAGAYAQAVRSDGAADYWRLGEATGSTGYDWAGYNDLTEQAGVTHGAAGAIGGDSDGASSFSGSTTGGAATGSAQAAPTTYSIEAWVTTTTTSGGEIASFGNMATGASNNYDRLVYMDNAGHLLFGVYSGGTQTVSGAGTYNDGQWHHVVATQSSAGMTMYVDGRRVGRNVMGANTPNTGYWRVGGDNINGWPAAPSSSYLAGSIDEVAVYPTAITPAQVQQHYTASGRTLVLPPVPTDRYGKAVYADSPDLFWRLDETAGPTAADSSANGTAGSYQGGVSYRAASTATAPDGVGVQLDGSSGQVVSQTPVANPTTYSEEAWFATTSTTGGKVIGFGNASSGRSNHYDRHVWMLDTGQLVFGTYTGQLNTAQSPAGYNDGAWHHVVATQGADGMRLYVDGAQVATNTQTGSEAYTGYWRVGGDNVWFGADSAYLAGTIDEVAVYDHVLPAARVAAHFAASGPDQAPVAAFTSSCQQLTCTFDGTGSTDPDGTVAGYAWSFGDGGSATGATATHAYAAAGDNTVRLTVTDDRGVTATTTGTVSPRPAANPVVTPFAADAFHRTVTGGLGTADTGGAWSTTNAAADLSVAGGSGSLTIRAAAAQASGFLGTPRATDAETAVTLTTDRVGTGNGLFAYVVGRRVSTGNEYRGRIRLVGKNVSVALTRLAGSGTDTVLQSDVALPGVVYTAGTPLRVRLQVTGTSPTTLRMKVWPAAAAEPAAWQVAATDSTAALQTAGGIGVTGYLAGNATNAPVTLEVSALTAASTAAAPTAAFTTSCTGLSCTADGSTSSDPNGPVSSYTWSWGDGVVTTGPTSTHSYAAAGSYRVTLTVTDPAGWTDVTTRTVTVPA